MEILEHFRNIIAQSEAPFVIEIGACDGYHSNLLLEIIKKKDTPFVFHAFEPNSDLHESIQRNLQGHLMFNRGIISVFPDAVGAENSKMTLHKSSGQKIQGGHVVDNYYGSSSIRKPKRVKEFYPDMKFSEETVTVISLDAHLRKYYLSNRIIDFIWADMQGAEIDLIKGAADAFNNVRYFYTEYSNTEDYAGQLIGIEQLLQLLPRFEVIENYGGDVLLKNNLLW